MQVTPGHPVSIGPKEPGSVAIYTAERLSTGALAVADLPLSAFIGAALGLVPVGAAKDAVAARKLPDNLAENLYEVVNVMASLFNVANAPHLKLYSLLAPGDPIPTDVAAMPSGLARRIDLAVKVPGYGDGKLSLVVPG